MAISVTKVGTLRSGSFDILRVDGFPSVPASSTGDVQTVKLGRTYELMGVKIAGSDSTDFDILIGDNVAITFTPGVHNFLRLYLKEGINVSAEWDLSIQKSIVNMPVMNYADWNDIIYMVLKNDDGANALSGCSVFLIVIPIEVDLLNEVISQT